MQSHLTFKIGQKVVYPNHGVSVVENIAKSNIPVQDASDDVYYHLRLLSNNSTVMVPLRTLNLLGLRPLSDNGEVRCLFDALGDGQIPIYGDWKGRYKENLDKMKTGKLTDVAAVLKNLSFVRQKKSLSFREKKMYERARYLIVSEVAIISKMSEKDVESLVDKALNISIDKPLNTSIAKPQNGH